MKTILAMTLAVVAGTGLSACVVHSHGRGGGHVGVEVAVPVVHVHDAYCGHYYYGDRWYYHERHSHGPGCGHVYIGGRWTIRVN